MGISIGGLSGSGLDTTSIIESLMEVERIPYTNLETKKTNLSSQQAVFRQLNTKLTVLQTAISELRYSSSFQANKANITNSNVGTVTTEGNATAGTYNINVVQLAQFETRTSASTYSASSEANTFSSSSKFKLGNFEVDINPLDNGQQRFSSDKEALENLVKQINANSSTINATATLVQVGVDENGVGKLQLAVTATEAKEASTVSFKLGNEDSQAVMVTNPNTSDGLPKVALMGKPAILEVNGIEVKNSTNQFDNVINGLTFNATSTGSTQIQVQKDTDAIVSKVESFVAVYNDVMSLLNTNLSKNENENLINPLQGDSTLKTIKNQLYEMMTAGSSYSGSGGKLGYLEELGLKIGADSSGKYTGLIELDKSKLTENIKSNSSKVEDLFTSTMDSAYSGIRTFTNSYTGTLTSKISGFDSQIKTVDEKLESMSRSLELKEARLKSQFTAMEVMLSSLNSTSNWLSSQLESLSGSKKS